MAYVRYLVVECILEGKIAILYTELSRNFSEIAEIVASFKAKERTVEDITKKWLTDIERRDMYVKVVGSVEEAVHVCKRDLNITLEDSSIELLRESYDKLLNNTI